MCCLKWTLWRWEQTLLRGREELRTITMNLPTFGYTPRRDDDNLERLMFTMTRRSCRIAGVSWSDHEHQAADTRFYNASRRSEDRIQCKYYISFVQDDDRQSWRNDEREGGGRREIEIEREIIFIASMTVGRLNYIDTSKCIYQLSGWHQHVFLSVVGKTDGWKELYLVVVAIVKQVENVAGY